MSCDFMEGNYSPFCLIFRPCLLWHRSLVSLSFHFTLSVSLLVSQRTRCKSSSSKCPTYVSLKVFVSLISLTFLMWKNNNSVAWHLKMYGPPSEEPCAECARTNQVGVSQAGSPRAWHSWLLQGCGEHRAGGIDILLCYVPGLMPQSSTDQMAHRHSLSHGSRVWKTERSENWQNCFLLDPFLEWPLSLYYVFI